MVENDHWEGTACHGPMISFFADNALKPPESHMSEYGGGKTTKSRLAKSCATTVKRVTRAAGPQSAKCVDTDHIEDLTSRSCCLSVDNTADNALSDVLQKVSHCAVLRSATIHILQRNKTRTARATNVNGLSTSGVWAPL